MTRPPERHHRRRPRFAVPPGTRHGSPQSPSKFAQKPSFSGYFGPFFDLILCPIPDTLLVFSTTFQLRFGPKKNSFLDLPLPEGRLGKTTKVGVLNVTVIRHTAFSKRVEPKLIASLGFILVTFLITSGLTRLRQTGFGRSDQAYSALVLQPPAWGSKGQLSWCIRLTSEAPPDAVPVVSSNQVRLP